MNVHVCRMPGVGARAAPEPRADNYMRLWAFLYLFCKVGCIKSDGECGRPKASSFAVNFFRMAMVALRMATLEASLL